MHRDVAPANVLLSTTGDVKLGDLGLAKATALADRTAGGTRKGRYAYMAPEQLAGEAVTSATDQFGLAVMLVELVAGARPFAGESPWVLLDAIRESPREDVLARVPPDVRAIAMRALSFDPRHRYESIEAMRAELVAAQRRREPAGPHDVMALVAGQR